MPSAEALQLMLDKMALHELVQNYCRAVDRRDYALLESVYHPDSIDDHSPMFKGSGPEFVRWVPSSVERFELTQHVIVSASFVVDGTIAEGECFIVAYHLRKQEPQRETIAHGRYLDRYEKRDGVWRIARRSVIYEKDRIDPVDPGAKISLDPALLARFPEGYRHLAYLQTKNGARVNPNLPTARGEALEKLLAEAKAWLAAQI